jgi:CDP-glucose 4,6-dehydratase
LGRRKRSVEKMVNLDFWKNRRVAITGHTGFKGSWLSFWLQHMEARVFGFSQPPATNPSLFAQLELQSSITHQIGEVRDFEAVKVWLSKAKPEVIIHLAAQPLVRQSYREPLETWQTNVLGTLNLLEAVRVLERPCAVVIVTTDKVYENRSEIHAYQEEDRIGGHDPYSSSKAAAEFAVSSWRASFFNARTGIRVATARAGNVIGGGDWAEDRIVPDLVRALSKKRSIGVRNPSAVRPWQHVLEPLSGYLKLAEKLFQDDNPAWQTAFNFGPEQADCRSVEELVEVSLRHWPGSWEDHSKVNAPHETEVLSLCIEKARGKLGWEPFWGFEEGVERTIEWYRKVMENQCSAIEMCKRQIMNFQGMKIPAERAVV